MENETIKTNNKILENRVSTARSVSAIRAAAASATTIAVLKITNQIDWDWTWVLSPVWVPLTFSFIYAVLAGVYISYQNINSR